MKYQEAIEEVSKELDLPQEVVKKAYESFWRFIKNHIKELPLKEDLSEEEFNQLRCNFNIPSIGKLACTYERFKAIGEKFKHIQGIRDGRFQEKNT